MESAGTRFGGGGPVGRLGGAEPWYGQRARIQVTEVYPAPGPAGSVPGFPDPGTEWGPIPGTNLDFGDLFPEGRLQPSEPLEVQVPHPLAPVEARCF